MMTVLLVDALGLRQTLSHSQMRSCLMVSFSLDFQSVGYVLRHRSYTLYYTVGRHGVTDGINVAQVATNTLCSIGDF
jgi:hypothetical protein